MRCPDAGADTVDDTEPQPGVEDGQEVEAEKRSVSAEARVGEDVVGKLAVTSHQTTRRDAAVCYPPGRDPCLRACAGNCPRGHKRITGWEQVKEAKQGPRKAGNRGPRASWPGFLIGGEACEPNQTGLSAETLSRWQPQAGAASNESMET